MSNFLAQFAAEEYLRRQTVLGRAVDAGQIDLEKATATLDHWLAIACAAGADLPELRVQCIWPSGKTVRRDIAEFGDPAIWRAELTRARDVAVRKSLANLKDLHAQQRAWDFQSLAINLGCPEMIALKEERNAA